ncbi:MAG: GNAT family N-acetyltransferase [Alphaproteobacteria bacterium]|jgi:GNAT superfamily N-acetyltransferase|nr:GNAT family N-acetyltransferase [Alphaproteobacteria bacterium]
MSAHSRLDPKFQIEQEDPAHPDSIWCLEQYFAEIDQRFATGFDRTRGRAPGDGGFSPPTGAFVIARASGEAVGCGGVAYRDGGFAEIKRMWVCETVRGQGLGYKLLLDLEVIASRAGFSVVRLDSNNTLTEAHRLYRRCGYSDVAPYNDNPYAELWFEKILT